MLADHLIKLGIAVLVGGLIGLEREFQYKAAGFRTIILITIGSTLYTMFSISIAGGTDSQTRIASNIITGIGFLGAGTILREGGRIGGLTTAATIWLAAALGMGIAAEEVNLVLISTGVTLMILLVFPRLVGWMDRLRSARTYHILIGSGSLEDLERLRQTFKEFRLLVTEEHIQISDHQISSTWRTTGAPVHQDQFTHRMLHDPRVLNLEY